VVLRLQCGSINEDWRWIAALLGIVAVTVRLDLLLHRLCRARALEAWRRAERIHCRCAVAAGVAGARAQIQAVLLHQLCRYRALEAWRRAEWIAGVACRCAVAAGVSGARARAVLLHRLCRYRALEA
jgi:hypothetical protein